MRLYIDIDTGEVSRQLGGQPLGSLVLYLRDIVPLEIVYLQAGVPVTSTVLADSAVQKIGVKAQASGDLLALASTYALAAEVASSSLSLNTEELVDYFTSFVPAGAREYAFLLEIEVVAADESTCVTYCQLTIQIRRDVNQPEDTTPSEVDADLYVLKGALFDAAGKPITPHFPGVRFDITTATAHRAIVTAGRTRPWCIITLENGRPCVWAYRDRVLGENDDTDTLRLPSDYHAVTNNGIWASTSFA